MNFAILSFIIGFILQFEALFLLLPWIVGMIYGEYHVALIYLATAVVCFILGKLLPQVPVSCPTWKHSAMPACSGAASLTGSAVWAYSYSLWRSCR